MIKYREPWTDGARATTHEYDLTVMRAVDLLYTTSVRDRPMTPYDHERLIIYYKESSQCKRTKQSKQKQEFYNVAIPVSFVVNYYHKREDAR